MCMKIFTSEELADLCYEWQQKLRLSHWNIAVRVCRADEMPIPDAQAVNEISLETERSLISILANEDYQESIFEQDMEVSLVHELLHIPMKYITDPEKGSLEYIHTEAFIEGLARLLVEQSRHQIT